jgi:predicted enzyme related to lactoylglutathione lyase
MPEGEKNFWAPYFIVTDTDAAIVTANGSGGSLLWGPQDSPHGRAAMLQDPSGATFFVISGEEM